MRAGGGRGLHAWSHRSRMGASRSSERGVARGFETDSQVSSARSIAVSWPRATGVSARHEAGKESKTVGVRLFALEMPVSVTLKSAYLTVRPPPRSSLPSRSEEHTSELQSRQYLV